MGVQLRGVRASPMRGRGGKGERVGAGEGRGLCCRRLGADAAGGGGGANGEGGGGGRTGESRGRCLLLRESLQVTHSAALL